MRPNSANVNMINNLAQQKPPSPKKQRPTSEVRSPARSTRRSKKSNKIETKSVNTMIPDYSASLEKSAQVIHVYEKQIQELQDEKSNLKDLIKRIKLEIKHTRVGNIDCTSVVKKYKTSPNTKRNKSHSRSVEDEHEAPELSCKEIKLNHEKIYYATNKLEGTCNRVVKNNDDMFKEIQQLRQEITKIDKQNKKAEKRRKKLIKRTEEENAMLTSLKQISKKMKKAVKNTEIWNQSLRQSNIKSSKRRKMLELNLQRLKSDSQMFYERAQTQAYNN